MENQSISYSWLIEKYDQVKNLCQPTESLDFEFSFGKPVSLSEIVRAEHVLGIKFPQSYKDFLMEIGSAELFIYETDAYVGGLSVEPILEVINLSNTWNDVSDSNNQIPFVIYFAQSNVNCDLFALDPTQVSDHTPGEYKVLHGYCDEPPLSTQDYVIADSFESFLKQMFSSFDQNETPFYWELKLQK